MALMDLNGTAAEESHSEQGSNRVPGTLGNVSSMDSVVLHHAPRIDDILKWTKEHRPWMPILLLSL
jgi:hypothetical protein